LELVRWLPELSVEDELLHSADGEEEDGGGGGGLGLGGGGELNDGGALATDKQYFVPRYLDAV
jgi:hypothetical protein